MTWHIPMKLCLVGAVALISACSGGSGTGTSGIRSVTNGQVAVTLSQELNDSVSSQGIGEVAYVSGNSGSLRTVVTDAGIPDANGVGPEVTTGTASYSARYAFVSVTDINVSESRISGRRGSASGVVNLTADFDAGTLTGQVLGMDVDGKISGIGLSGSVSASSRSVSDSDITGRLEGSIGQNGVAGAFQGDGGDTSFAGGFVGPAR